MKILTGDTSLWLKRVLTLAFIMAALPFSPEPGSVARAQGQLLPAAGPAIHNITDNRGAYPNAQVPNYQKLEITFQVDTQAANVQFPYDPTPPTGVQPGPVSAWTACSPPITGERSTPSRLFTTRNSSTR